MTLYFAYGSNLSHTQMSLRCPHSTYHALGVLPCYKWIIGERGYANIISSSNPNDSVIGMLYMLSPSDEETLDRAEGVPHAYTKHHLPISILTPPPNPSTLKGGVLAHPRIPLDPEYTPAPGPTTVEALVYIDARRLEEGVCKEEYVHRMNRGIKDAVAKGMSQEYVKQVMRRFVREEEVLKAEEVKDPFHI